MVCDGVEIEWLAQLHLKARRVSDGLAFGIAVCVIGGRDSAECVGIKRVVCVYMQITKVGVSQSIGVCCASKSLCWHV